MLTVFPALACIVASTVAMAVGCALPAGTGVMDAARAGSRAQRGHRPRFELFVTGTNVAVVAAATRTVTIEAIVADRACILDTERPDLARLAGPRAQCGRRPSVELPPARPLPAELFRFAVILVIFFVAINPTS